MRILFLIFFTQMVSAFPIGERLEYNAYFGFINLGRMVLEIVDTISFNGRECYIISSKLNSNPGLKSLFSLNDTIDVYTTVDNLLPVFYRKKINEGKYSKTIELHFNHDSLFVTDRDSLYTISPETRDILSFWYYLRKIPLIVGDTVRMMIYESGQNHRIECPVRKREKIKTPLGEFATIRVAPQTRGKGVFGQGGSMEIWYSDDRNRFPVQIKTKLKFGSVIFKLMEVKN